MALTFNLETLKVLLMSLTETKTVEEDCVVKHQLINIIYNPFLIQEKVQVISHNNLDSKEDLTKTKKNKRVEITKLKVVETVTPTIRLFQDQKETLNFQKE